MIPEAISKCIVEFFCVKKIAKKLKPTKTALAIKRVLPSLSKSNCAVTSALHSLTDLNEDHLSQFKIGLTSVKIKLLYSWSIKSSFAT